MGIKTTHIVTRDFAIAAILKKQDEIYELNNEDLSELLEETLHNGFYNFRIVSDEEHQQNKYNGYPTPYLDDIANLPPRNDSW